MKRFLKKKQWMMVALVGALGLAVYLNFYLTGDTSSALTAGESAPTKKNDSNLGDATFVGAGVEDGSYFSEARAVRTAAREESLAILQEVVDSAGASAADKAQATEKATAIAENVLQESNIENLLLAKGFADSVVYIDGDRCSVVVQATELQQQESLQILQIVVSQSDVAADQVQIMTADA